MFKEESYFNLYYFICLLLVLVASSVFNADFRALFETRALFEKYWICAPEVSKVTGKTRKIRTILVP